jgi:hypothetical protein
MEKLALKLSVDKMETKICSKCGFEKILDEFYFRKDRKAFEGVCRECSSRYKSEWYEDNKEDILIDRKMKWDNRSEDEKAQDAQIAKQWAKNNPEKRAAHKKKWIEANPEYHTTYRSDPENKRKRNKNEHERRQNNPGIKLRQDISSAIGIALKKCSGSKNKTSILDYLPQSIEEIKTHIENLFSHPSNLTTDGKIWMTWDNRGKYNPKTWNDNDPGTWTWQLDHIIPQADLPYSSMEDESFKICWSLENLRPYSAKQNILDGTSRIRHTKNSKNKDIK